VKDATYLNCLLEFTGQVCYYNDLCYYCGDAPDYPLCGDAFTWNDAGFVCCTDTYDDSGLLVVDTCNEPAQSNCGDPNYINPDTGEICDPDDLLCVWACPEGTNEVEPLCRNYTDPTWVFNISDFVNVLLKSETNGAYVVKLRFYPL
jgi:hypothetical protein